MSRRSRLIILSLFLSIMPLLSIPANGACQVSTNGNGAVGVAPSPASSS